jgi:HrpA-like RNA helicase
MYLVQLNAVRAIHCSEAEAAAQEAYEAEHAGMGNLSSTATSTASTDSSSSVPQQGLVVKVFAALPQDQQLLAFAPAPPNTRKFVLATNIAETSITISGVRYVIDCGFVKQRSFMAGTGMEALKVCISNYTHHTT